jgi:hypothetical protein
VSYRQSRSALSAEARKPSPPVPYTKYIDAIDITFEPVEDQIVSLYERTNAWANI